MSEEKIPKLKPLYWIPFRVLYTVLALTLQYLLILLSVTLSIYYVHFCLPPPK